MHKSAQAVESREQRLEGDHTQSRCARGSRCLQVAARQVDLPCAEARRAKKP
jgi:hypothetical protein